MCASDCGRCIDCIETDDYAPTWRNPRFQAATSTDRHRPARLERWDGKDAQPPIDVPAGPPAPVLGRDGGER